MVSIILSTIALIFGIIGSSPFLLKVAIHYLYDPGLEAKFTNTRSSEEGELETVPWEKINPYQSTPGRFDVMNRGDKSIKLSVLIRVDESWLPNEDVVRDPLFEEIEIGQGIRTSERILGEGGGHSITFPFQPDTEKAVCEVIVFPSIDAYQIGLPSFLGEYNLQPIKKEYHIEVNSEYLDKVFSSRFPEYEPENKHN